ncbi:MAG: SCO family protein [Pyrinomonadaceae bacterium]
MSFSLPALAQYGRPPQNSMPQGGTPEMLKKVGIEQKLNGPVPLDAVFRDESGREVRLGEYFAKGKPVVVSLVYYKCPMLCNQVLDGLVGTMQAIKFNASQEYEVITVSFDPRETPSDAAEKKALYLKRYGREGAEKGWHFLVGGEESIKKLTEAVGFNYAFDERSDQFAHASAIMVATPEGKLSHYFYGIEYAPKDVRLSLIQASANKIGSPVDQLILYCYHYDPTTGKYGPVIMNIMRVAGVATVLGVVALLFALGRRKGARPAAGGGVKVGGMPA